MVFTERDTELYRRDVKAKGNELSAAERERLLEPYLSTIPTPDVLTRTSPRPKRPLHTPRVRPFLRTSVHALIYFIIQLIFGWYLRFRQTYYVLLDRFLAILYYHHRTPELIQKDVKMLSRLPEHLSVIVTLRKEQDDGLERLLDEVAELSAWCACAGIPLLSVYEKSGILKSYMSSIHKIVNRKLEAYFGPPPATPKLRVLAPNHPSMSASASPHTEPQNGHINGMTNGDHIPRPGVTLNLLLLSSSDGRDTIVDLTKTLAEMSQSQKLNPKDITSELIDTEICATTTIPPPAVNGDSPENASTPPAEPELLIIFGPRVKLQGYPPWQMRLTEIFCVGDSSADLVGNGDFGVRVEYQAFLRGLWRFAGAQMRFGR